jgi:hypothetical protein
MNLGFMGAVYCGLSHGFPPKFMLKLNLLGLLRDERATRPTFVSGIGRPDKRAGGNRFHPFLPSAFHHVRTSLASPDTCANTLILDLLGPRNTRDKFDALYRRPAPWCFHKYASCSRKVSIYA